MCAFAVIMDESFARVAAGVTWTRVIAHAPWPAGEFYGSLWYGPEVIYAAGAFYAIGQLVGATNFTDFRNGFIDVWKSRTPLVGE
jgi:hypothetical protein